MSWRVTITCSRAQGERVANADELFPSADDPPVLVADEPDAAKPDDWVIHAYFDHEPRTEDLRLLAGLGTGEPRLEQLGEADWVTMSQAGLQPIRAGRFYVHTPMHRGAPPGTIPFEIDASLAFGTGQHATTAGCLEALDRLERSSERYANIGDIGTGTGLTLPHLAAAVGPRGRIVGLDRSPAMLAGARDRAPSPLVRGGRSARAWTASGGSASSPA